MKKIILLVLIALVITAGWFLYFKGDDGMSKVSVVYAEYKDLSNTLEFSGEVVPQKIYSVQSTAGGRIESIRVSEGSVVRKGDVLLKLDTSQIEIELSKAKLTLDQMSETQSQVCLAGGSSSYALAQEKAKIALALSQTTGYDYESFNSAFGSELDEQAAEYVSAMEGLRLTDVTQVGYTDYTNADNEMRLLELNIDSLETALEDMTIRSEIDGTVVSLTVNEGEVLSPGYPAMVIADTDNTLIRAYVYEKDIDDIEHGMNVRIIGDPGYYTGIINSIGSSAAGVGEAGVFDTMTKVEIEPEERFSRMPGAVVDIEVIVSSAEDALCLPADCFTNDNCIFVVDEEGVLEKRTVAAGFKDMYYTQIVKGVSEGEMVVVSPDGLEQGQKVEYDLGE